MAKRKISKVGLDASGRIDWGDWRNTIIAFWAGNRFHGRFIAEQTGLTLGQVYERCHRYGIKLRDARDGVGPESEQLTALYGIGKITRAKQIQVLKQYPDPTEYDDDD